MNTIASPNSRAMSDERWLSEHFRENYAMLQAIGRLLVGSSPEYLDIIDDEIQEVFVSLWRKRDKLREHPNIDAWLVEALRRQLLGHFSRFSRRQRRVQLEYADDPKEAALGQVAQHTYPDPGETLEGKERYAQLEAVLGRENAEIFYAFCVESYSAKELAARYGCSENCIWTRISRSKRRILAAADIFFALMLAFMLRV